MNFDRQSPAINMKRRYPTPEQRKRMGEPAARIVDQAFSEYGDEKREAVYAPAVVAEFIANAKQAMKQGNETITLPTSMVSLIAFFLDTRVKWDD